MSAKSNKKYYERRTKKTSREISEARHKLNAFDKSTKSKKIDSGLDSIPESDNEILVPPKKNEKGERVEKLEQAKSQISQPKPEKKAGSRKRKQDDDGGHKTSKVLKQNSFDNNPSKNGIKMKKFSLSTTPFLVEDAGSKSQPSNYLEQSVCLSNTQSVVQKIRANFVKPKVLPFIPTASTSGSGLTTNFQVSVIPKTMKLVAQSTHANIFKNKYINNKKVKKFGT